MSEGNDKRRLSRLTYAQAGILLSLDEPQIERATELLLKSYTQMEECGSTVDVAAIATLETGFRSGPDPSTFG